MAVIRKLETPESQLPSQDGPPKRRKNHGQHDDSNWIVSYADMMTLLCVFYIMMFSMSKHNTAEFEKAKQEIAQHFNKAYEPPTAPVNKITTQIIHELGIEKDASVTSDGVSVNVAFHSTLFFDSSSAEISPAGHEILKKIASSLQEQQKKDGKVLKVVVEGHTDSQPILGGSFPSNWELSSARATRVIRLFIDSGFHPVDLLAIGYADTQPLVKDRNADGSWSPEGLAKNRRVILRIMLPEADSIPWKAKSASAPVSEKM